MKYIVRKLTFFDAAIRKNHFSLAILNSCLPFSSIGRTIDPIHFTETFSFIIFVITFINVSTFPSKNTISILFVLKIFSFICITQSRSSILFPFSFSMFETFLELTYICTTVSPLILALSIWFSIYIGTRVRITVCKNICALTMF